MRPALIALLLAAATAHPARASHEQDKAESGRSFGEGVPGASAAGQSATAAKSAGEELTAVSAALATANTLPVIIATGRAAIPQPSLPTRRREWPKEEGRWGKIVATLGAGAALAPTLFLLANVPSFLTLAGVLAWSGFAAGFVRIVLSSQSKLNMSLSAALAVAGALYLEFPPIGVLLAAASAAWVSHLLLNRIASNGNRIGLAYALLGPMTGLIFGSTFLVAGGAGVGKKLGAALGRWLDRR